MILRKPYAFLIKQFRIIHLLLSFIVAYLIYNTTDILKVYNSYISTKQLSELGTLSRPLMYLALFVFILSILIVTIVLKIKKKPILLYIINTIITITVIGVYIYAYSTLKVLEASIVDIRILRVVRDILIILVFLQSIQFITLFVRATGFDIKKFDFGADLIGLQITEEDREEVEISLELDSDVSKRKIVSFFKNFKYTYLENKLLFNLLLAIILVFAAVLVLYKIVFRPKTYEIKQNFTVSNFIASVNNAYMTDKNYNGEVISDEYEYVVLNLSIKAFNENQRLNLGDAYLKIKNKKYYSIKTNANIFDDLGKVYSNQIINNKDFDQYLIVFKILKTDIDNDIKFIYNSVLVNIGKLSSDNVADKKELGLNQKLEIDTSYLKGTLGVYGIEINKEFHETYSSCILNDCEVYNYIVAATRLTNYDTTLIKLDAEFESNDTNLYDFLKNYGTIRYGSNSSEKSVVINLVESKMDNYYLEVNSNISNSEYIYLDLNLRNNKYTFKLK